MKLVPDWKQAWTWYSMHGAAVLTALSAVQVAIPQMQAILPWPVFGKIATALGVAIIVGRLIQQGKGS